MNHYGPSAGPECASREGRGAVPRPRRERHPGQRDHHRERLGGLDGVALALYDPGDEVLVPNPGFVLYGPHARLCGATPVPYTLDERKSFQPNLDELEAAVTPRTRAIVVNSPSNPTGGVFPRPRSNG